MYIFHSFNRFVIIVEVVIWKFKSASFEIEGDSLSDKGLGWIPSTNIQVKLLDTVTLSCSSITSTQSEEYFVFLGTTLWSEFLVKKMLLTPNNKESKNLQNLLILTEAFGVNMKDARGTIEIAEGQKIVIWGTNQDSKSHTLITSTGSD